MKDIAFEVFTIKDGKKDKVWKISLNSRVEGFEGDPLIVNYVQPKIMSYEGMVRTLQQQLELAEDYIKKLEARLEKFQEKK